MVTFLYQNNEPTLWDFAAFQKKKIKVFLGDLTCNMAVCGQAPRVSE